MAATARPRAQGNEQTPGFPRNILSTTWDPRSKILRHAVVAVRHLHRIPHALENLAGQVQLGF